jgi:hypothetical protein
MCFHSQKWQPNKALESADLNALISVSGIAHKAVTNRDLSSSHAPSTVFGVHGPL